MANLAKDLSGMQFGTLSVLGSGPNSSDGRARWYVRCGCGKELLVTSSNLLLGRTKSCGCSKKNNKPHISIAGERFGRLVAIERLGTKSKSVIWRCRCDCGNETSVSLSNLRSGHTTSCGCAKREAQQDVSARVSGIRRSEKTGKFESNTSSKGYILSKGERIYRFRNMRNFLREHPDLFGIAPDEKEIQRAASGLSAAARKGYQYHGWCITYSDPEEGKARPITDSMAKHLSDFQRIGTNAAMMLPESQRGPQNRTSKIWILIDPSGSHVPVVNLLDWCRENYTLFEPPCENIENAAHRVASGFRAIASSMRGVKSRKRPVSSYKGWGLAKVPIKKQEGTKNEL